MTKRQFMFENRQAPGDILMMTCAIRDLHRSYPHSFTTEVATTCQDIWRNNPYTDKLDRKQLLNSYRLGYSHGIQQSNQRSGHFATAFTRDLSQRLGLKVTPTDLRPDLHLTEQEETTRPFDHPYWLAFAGGKPDFTAKIWDPRYYQAVAAAMPDIKFVQVGQRDHLHRPLAGMIDRIGQTSLRELIWYVRHADGVLCPVTCGMHLAAALNRPCVVVAGGREPWWWEAYTRETWEANIDKPVPRDFVPHRFLHNIGQYSCCREGGCWKSGVGEKPERTRNCIQVVKGPTRQLPLCMRDITPEMVVRAIRDYQNGVPVPANPIPPALKAPLTDEPLPPVPRAVQVPPKPVEPVAPRHRNRRQRVQRVPVPSYQDQQTPKPRIIVRARSPLVKTVSVRPPPRPAPEAVRKAVEVVKAVTASKTAALVDHAPSITVAVLLYGDYPELARRCLQSIYRAAAPSQFQLRIGLNAVGEATREYINTLNHDNLSIIESRQNIFKYPMMRRMQVEPGPVTTDWWCWFDDDSFCHAGWFRQLAGWIRMHPEARWIGKRYYMHLKPGQFDWIKAATWYRGVPLENRNGVPISNFATGGWWCCRTNVMRAMDWPDPRLQNNGGDVMMGVAAHQHGVALHQFYDGIEISKAKRRGASQRHPGT